MMAGNPLVLHRVVVISFTVWSQEALGLKIQNSVQHSKSHSTAGFWFSFVGKFINTSTEFGVNQTIVL